MSADPPVLKLAVRENWRFSDLENELTIVFSVGNFFSVILITVILHATFYNLNSKTYSLMFVRVVHFRACVLPPVSAAPAQCLHHSPSLGARPSGGSGGLNGRSTCPRHSRSTPSSQPCSSQFLAKFRQNVARFRLYRLRSLQENTRFAVFFKIYQIIMLKILKLLFGKIVQILRHLQFFC